MRLSAGGEVRRLVMHLALPLFGVSGGAGLLLGGSSLLVTTRRRRRAPQHVDQDLPARPHASTSQAAHSLLYVDSLSTALRGLARLQFRREGRQEREQTFATLFRTRVTD